MMQFTRQYLAGILRMAGMPDAADAAVRELPEVADQATIAEWCAKHGISMDELISMRGGSP